MHDVILKENVAARNRILGGIESVRKFPKEERAVLAPLLLRAKSLMDEGKLHKAAAEIDCAARCVSEPAQKARLFRLAADAYFLGGDSRGNVHGELCMHNAGRWAELAPANGKKKADAGLPK